MSSSPRDRSQSQSLGQSQRRQSVAPAMPLSQSSTDKSSSGAPPSSPGHGPQGAQGAASPAPAASSETENVKVVCRVRPFNGREIELHNKAMETKDEWDRHSIRSVVEFQGQTCVFLDDEKQFQERERFAFDACLWSIPDEIQTSGPENPFADQSALFEQYGKMMLLQAWKGYNTCFFAYGQTGSGKTFSMMGGDEGQNPGLIPRTCQQLFQDVERYAAEAESHRENFVQSFKIEVRFLEIYNENVKDLLWSLSPLPPDVKAKVNSENLRVRSSPATGVFVESLTAVEVDSWKRMNELITLGNSCKHISATKMNERSSRSHTIFKITLHQVTTAIPKKQFEKPTEHVRESVINLIDLAGSERNKKTGATGDRLKEASSINKSLHCLKFVIDVLVDNATQKGPKKRPPYRDSTLTSLLMDSLGGNSKTFMLVCVSPHSDNAEETLTTLRYGARARQIVTTVHVNENTAGRMMVELEEELERMKNELDRTTAASAAGESVTNLKAQIAEHEAAMQALEHAINDQHTKLSQLKEQQDRETRRRYNIAFQRIQSMQLLKGERKQLVQEYTALKKHVDSLETEKSTLDTKIRQVEQEQERLREDIDALQHKSAECEIETDQWKKKIHRLEATKRELVSNIEEQEEDIRRTVNTKHAVILKARAVTARLRVTAKRQLAEQQQRHEMELAALRERCAKDRDALLADTRGKEAEIDRSIAELNHEHDALMAEVRKVEHEKGSQVAALEAELATLQSENRRRTEQGSERIKNQSTDWDAKYSTMEAEMSKKHDETKATWAKKHQDEVAAAEDALESRRQQLNAEIEETRRLWADKIKEDRESSEERKRHSTQEWEAALQQKLKANHAMREALRSIDGRSREYGDMSRRIATVLESAPPPHTQSESYQHLFKLIVDFQTEYELNAPSRFKLSNLLRDDFQQTRCAHVPLVGVSDADPKTAGVTLERLRPKSPRRAL